MGCFLSTRDTSESVSTKSEQATTGAAFVIKRRIELTSIAPKHINDGLNAKMLCQGLNVMVKLSSR